MTTQDDPLTKAPGPVERLFYATGILLDAQDFRTEQSYHRGRLARALAYLFGSGTAAGLRVVWEPALEAGEAEAFPAGREEQLIVQPGLAIDRLGRLIELPRTACIRLARWYESQSPNDLRQGIHGAGIMVDVFVRFVVCEHGKTPAFASGPFDALDAVAPSRLRDYYELALVIRQEADPSLPQSPWPDPVAFPDPVDRQAALQEAIFAAWREGSEDWDQAGPVPLPEHVLNQDPTSLFLARLLIPATTEGTAVDERPVRTPDAPVEVDNNSRAFIYTTAALARWLGL